jgi:hypothetical protein
MARCNLIGAYINVNAQLNPKFMFTVVIFYAPWNVVTLSLGFIGRLEGEFIACKLKFMSS